MPFPSLRAGCQFSIAARKSVSDLPGTGGCESQMLPSTDFVPSRTFYTRQENISLQGKMLLSTSVKFFPFTVHYSLGCLSFLSSRMNPCISKGGRCRG